MKNELTGEDIADDKLASIATLAQQQIRLENKIEDLEKVISTLKEELLTISQSVLPDAMAEIGLSEFKLTDGSKVSTKPYYSCKIADDKMVEALLWLRKNNHSDIIKNNVTVSFGMGEDKKATNLVNSLTLEGFNPEQKIFVHPQTLKSFVREQVESQKPLPMDLFGVTIGKITKITPPKQ